MNHRVGIPATGAQRSVLIAQVAGAATTIVGLVVLVGWYAQVPGLLQMHHTFVAMQVNTAIAFFLLGGGVVAAARGRVMVSAICGIVTLVLAGVTLAQYLGLQIAGFDNLVWHLGVSRAMESYTAIKTSAPGRMAPNTTVCFILGSIALIGSAAHPRSRLWATIASGLGMMVVGIAVIALLGYLGGAPTAYGWGKLTRMAVHTAVAMAIGGIGISALVAYQLQSLGVVFMNRLPTLVATGGIVVTLGLWQATADQQHQQIERDVQSTAERLRTVLEATMRSRLLVMERMKKRWELGEPPRENVWKYEAELNVAHFPEYRAIVWVDTSLQPRWTASSDSNGGPHLRILSSATISRLGTFSHEDTQAAVQQLEPHLRDASLVIATPLGANGRFDGFLVGVISARRILDAAIEAGLAHEYLVSASASGAPIYESSSPAGGIDLRQSVETELAFGGVAWRLRVTPTKSLLASMDSRASEAVVVVGVLITVLLAWALGLAQRSRAQEIEQLASRERLKDAATARERTAELSVVNERLLAEIAERKRAEQEQRTLQAQLLQAQKMEAVGQLAGGVAHDFNNLLTAIKTSSELLLEDIDLGDPRRDDVTEINNAADRAAALTRQLLAFSRQQIMQPQAVDLNHTISQFEKMLRRLIPANITLRTSADSEAGAAWADPGQLEQVLMNLVVNARDAMPDGGIISIETANSTVDEAYATGGSQVRIPPGDYVVLSVSDTGCGMDEKTQARIFEPFFTTKEQGKGTGLGLSTVYGIVEQTGGYVWLYSEVGWGSTFKIYLPLAETSPTTEVVVRFRPLTSQGSETILIVEDDEPVRAISRRILAKAGYQVLEATNGVEALKVCEQSPIRIDLIISDIVMPEMGGQELLRRLGTQMPSTKVLMTSGYTEDPSFRQWLFEPGTPFLEKPYTAHSLLAKTREVLDSDGMLATASASEQGELASA